MAGLGGSSLAYMAMPYTRPSLLSSDPPPEDSLQVGVVDTTVATESTGTKPKQKTTTTTPPIENNYVFPDRYGDPFNNKPSNSPFVLKPNSEDLEIKLEDDLSGFTFKESVEDLEIRPPSKMSPQDFAEYRKNQLMDEYWEKISLNKEEEERKAPNPLNKIIYKPGTTEPLVEIKPAGSINVRFGGRWQRTENPAVPRNLQRTGAFDFDQQIKINLQGDIGERLKVNANWNTNASFDVDNNLKIAFQGKEEDWLRDIQAGNISVPLNTQLIQGANQLFGVKAVMQFGKVGVTSFVSSQQGKRESITIRGGGQSKEFEFAASEYDAYKHFFLSHYFRDVFEQAYEINPVNPNNGFTISRVEAFITNTNINTENLKNVIGFIDLAEQDESVLTNPGLVRVTANGQIPFDTINNILDIISTDSTFRNTDLTTQTLESLGFVQGRDFEKINNTRALEEGTDFTFHPELGFISLTRRLQDDEALCVSFEYTLNGVNYTVGELQNDYQSLGQDEAIITKLIKPSRVDLTIPTWDLMMKNIYSLNTQRVSKENFQLRVIYKDDASGLDNPSLQEGEKARNVPLLQLFGLDKLDPNGDKISDGNFDFIEDATILTARGHLLFPTPEPFGDFMERRETGNVENAFFNNNEQNLKNRYVFRNLYDNTQAEARRSTTFNKFFIRGRFESATTQNIRLPGFGVSEGSVTVQSGAVNLTEGVHYTVNYSANTVNIIDAGVFESGNDIKISFEAPDLFRFRQKSLIGTRVEYNHSKDYNFGATVMRINEQPLAQRISVGDETLNNTQIGADFSFQQDSRLLTKIVDFLPVIQTKAKSSINGSAEVAMLVPGSSRILEDGGASYIDDFEGAETPFDFSRSLNQWVISTPPRILGNGFSIFEDFLKNDIGIGDHRGKLAWYNPDQSFYLSGQGRTEGIGDQEIQNSNPYTRGIDITDIFRRSEPGNVVNNLVNTFNLNYYPAERGPYNYNTNASELNADGTFRNPENNWAGITRAVTNDTDFENANIEFLEFWVLDPFLDEVYDAFPEELNGVPRSDMGGELYFNLGDVSEDVIKDRRHGFENGLPVNVDSSDFGLVTNLTFLNNAFETSQDRGAQDKGFDGLTDEEERSQDFFGPVVDELSSVLNPDALAAFNNDPSSDNFEYYITQEDINNGDDPDGRSIIERYKNFNGYEDNSPIGSIESSSTLPDNEDLNNNKTLDETDRYFQYSMPINTEVFNGTANHPYINSVSNDGLYYQIRIPIRDFDRAVNGISSFNTIKYMRMYMTGFRHPVALRMVNLQLISAQWRKFVGNDLDQRDATLAAEPQSRRTFVSTVNVEENDNYQLPPGTTRDRNQAAINNAQLNEQSLQICTDELRGQTGVGAFKNITTDLINYRRLKMFIHGESSDANTEDDELDVFLRLGTDLTENYYEIAVPLKLSPRTDPTTQTAEEIWIADNEIDIPISDLTKVKLARNNSPDANRTRRFTQQIGRYKITVVGTPDRSTIRTAMLGMNNITEEEKTACVWFNELRVAEFDKSIGWAGVGNINATLADLGSVSASVNFTSANWGDLETQLADRTRENNLSYGAQTNLALHKFGADKIGLKLPFFASIDGQRVTPRFDPFDPDVEFRESKNSKSDSAARRLEEVGTYTRTIKSINLTNVKKEKIKKDAKKHFYDVENLNVSLSYKEEKRQGAQNGSPFGNAIDSYLDQTYRGVAGYAYNFQNKPAQPFKKLKWKSDYFKLIKDFNFSPVPSSIAFTGTLNRRYFRNQLLNSELNTNGVQANFEKSFTFDRVYTMRWNLAKSLNLNYAANASALIDEPAGDREGEDGLYTADDYRRILWDNVKDLGRLKTFNQTATVTYKLPINKVPLFSWVSSDAKFKVGNNWQASAFQQADNPLDSPVALRDTSSELGADGVRGRVLGNNMSNDVDFRVNANFNFEKLYNKSKFLKAVGTKQRKKPKRIVVPKPKKEEEKKEGEEEEEKEEKPKKKLSAMKGVRIPFRTLMLVRNLQLTYNEKSSTELPAVLLTPRFLGGDYDDEFDGFGPGLPFLTGSQNLNVIKNEASRNGWYSKSLTTNDPIQQRRSTSITAKASIEPFKDFRIKLNADYNETELYTEIFKFSDETNTYGSISPIYSGSVKMSYITFPTAFARDREDNSNRYFEFFDQNRKVIADKLNEDDNGEGVYTRKSKDALIPAFISAYTGRKFNNTSEVSSGNLRSVPRIPLPNWRLDYAGLSRLPALRKKFSTFSIKHAYSSSYEIRSFRSATGFRDIDFRTNVRDTEISLADRNRNINANGAYEPLVNVDEVQIVERFSPLIGINVRTRKSKINFKLDYNKSRSLTLDNGSFRITEATSDDIVVGFGKTKRNANLTNLTLGLIKKPDGTDIILKNNLTFKTDLSIRNRKTVQRKFEEDSEESISGEESSENGGVTAGDLNFQLRPNLNYQYNSKLNIQLFFERTINIPQLSSSLVRKTTAFGVNVRFSLT